MRFISIEEGGAAGGTGRAKPALSCRLLAGSILTVAIVFID
jgi:hypothetical protein